MAQIINCHTHLFTSQHVPDGFLPYPLVPLLRVPAIRRSALALMRFFDPLFSGHSLARTARFAAQAASPDQAHTFARLRRHYPDDTVFVVLPMDFEQCGMGRPPVSVERQHRELLDLAKGSGGRLLPFCAVDPRRDHLLDDVKRWVDDGFRGLKLYPPLGYRPGELMEVLRFADSEHLPVIAHCLVGPVRKPGFSDADVAAYSHPANYLPVLQELPTLRLCLAHFGGQDEWDRALQRSGSPDAGKDRPWVEVICDLLRQGYPHLYTDLSYTMFVRTRYQSYLKVLLQEPAIAERVLFGTDWYMVEREKKSEKQVCVELRAMLGEALWTRISHTNPRRFLGPRTLKDSNIR